MKSAILLLVLCLAVAPCLGSLQKEILVKGDCKAATSESGDMVEVRGL